MYGVKKSISIIGEGPATLIIAALLDCDNFKVTIYEKNKILGRKLLLAGKRVFNLIYLEVIDGFTEIKNTNLLTSDYVCPTTLL